MTFYKCLQFDFAARLIEIKLKSRYGLVLFSNCEGCVLIQCLVGVKHGTVLINA